MSNCGGCNKCNKTDVPWYMEVIMYTAIMLAFAILLYFGAPDEDTVPKRSCDVVEISPDFTAEHRQWCRQQRARTK